MKIVRKSNFRVVVTPRRLGDYGSIRISDNFFGNKSDEQIEKDYLNRCKDIADQIKRHVDDVDSVEVDYDAEEPVCSHCNLDWDIDEDGCPTCCNKAIEEFEQSKQETK